MRDTLDDLIRRHLPAQAVPTVPELRLHLAGPESGLGRLTAGVAGAGSPYWAHVWAGGLVLARYLLDHPGTVAGRRVLDLGCGSGVVAIAAARAGARLVAAVDVDPWAAAATTVNAGLNGVAVTVRCGDPLDDDGPATDVVLVGDLFYDAALASRVAAFLDRCLEAGLLVLVGDPGRTPLPCHRLEPIHRSVTHDFGRAGEDVPATVSLFKRPVGVPRFSGTSRWEG